MFGLVHVESLVARELLFGIAHEINIPLALKNSLTLVDSPPPLAPRGGWGYSSEVWVEVFLEALNLTMFKTKMAHFAILFKTEKEAIW